jgi:type I restriction enzyme, S subunit
MSSDWVEIELGEFLELKRGYDLPKSVREEGEVLVVSSSGPTGTHNTPMVKGPVVVTGRYGTIGEVYYVEDDCWPLNTTLYVRDFKGNNPLFTYYLLKTINYSEYSDKGAVPGVNRNHLHMAKIRVPVDPNMQREIAARLWDLDRKISLNRQASQTLKQMAQAIFKSWFIDFDPVHAKMAGRQPEGMGAATAALFPDELIDSEIGQIPNGWSYRKASDVVDLSIGKTPPRKEPEWFSESVDDVKWVSIRDMGSSGIYVLSTSERLTEEAIEKFNVRRVKDNTVILSFKLTVGRVAITVGEMLTNEAIAHFNVRSGAPLCSEYLYLYLLGFNYSSLGSTSSIATAVNSATIKNMPILCASESVVLAFRHVVEPFFEKIKLLEQQNTLLSEARDVLLPRLLSGELIPDFRVS